jgi:FtsH-binding integral membrane protein
MNPNILCVLIPLALMVGLFVVEAQLQPTKKDRVTAYLHCIYTLGACGMFILLQREDFSILECTVFFTLIGILIFQRNEIYKLRRSSQAKGIPFAIPTNPQAEQLTHP